ncbi:MAG: class I SAM-dependent methyltransferase [Thermodesulfobacteriota bacterium]
MVQIEKEEQRIRAVYARRDSAGKPALYEWHRQDVIFSQYRSRAVAACMLAGDGLRDLSKIEILDVGCGSGGWLRTLMDWGASPKCLHGIDLLDGRIESARNLASDIDFQVASGCAIPFGNSSMDLVSANTVFSSILDRTTRLALAKEMSRVVKPNGRVLIFDYRISDPRNPDTTGIRKGEIRRLFPGFGIQSHSLILAPPLLRPVAPVSLLLAHLFEFLFPFLRTHAFYLLRHSEPPFLRN